MKILNAIRDLFHIPKADFYPKYRRYRLYYEVLLKWMLCDVHGRSIETEFLEHGMKKIAIYGVGDFGVILFRKLKESEIEVACFIDKFSKLKKYGINEINVVGLDGLGDLQDVDAIVISSFWQKKAIGKELKNRGVKNKIISLDEIIMKM